MNLDAIFKAYDIRGLVPDEMNEDVVYGIGRAFAEFIARQESSTKEPAIVVGYDMRSDSKALARAAIEGINKQGRDVIDIGQVSTDMVYFAAAHLQAAGGLVVTASHNPGAYNGIKLCRDHAIPVGVDGGLPEIQEILEAEDFPRRDHGSKRQQAVTDEWIEHALRFTKDLKPYHVAVDAGNGMAGAVVPHLEGKSPLGITPMYFELDGSFPNHEANPMKVETLEDLSRKVTESDIDFGLAFDGDGDRMALVDEKGRPVDGSTTFALLAWSVLDENPGANIVYDLRMSRSALEFIESKGGNPIRSKVGNPSIKQLMRDKGAPLGGETTGHFVLRDNYYIDSGLVSALVAIDTLSRQNLKLADFMDEITSYWREPEANFEVEDKQAAIERLATEFDDGEQDRLDGLTVNYTDWWFNVRPSNTEALLRLNIEGRTEEQVKQAMKRIDAIIKS